MKTLTQHYVNTFRHVYFDNFFTGVGLLLDLLKSGLYACGTIRSNRKGFPKDLKPVVKKGMKERGDSQTRQYNNLTVSVWQDSKAVSVAATNGDATVDVQVLRKKKDGTRTPVKCPQSISLYNKYMGGVDHNDQLRGYYHVRLKCRKYYKYIFWFLFDVAVINSYILAKHYTDLNIKDVKTFRTELAKGLIGQYCSRKRSGRATLHPAKRFCAAHFPMRGAEKVHRCHYCHTYKHQRHETVWHCKDCDRFLCHNGREDDCFRLYHTYYVTSATD